MSKRTDILAEIKRTLEGIMNIETVEVDRIDAVDISISPLPAAFIYSGKDKLVDVESPAIGSETWDWEIIIEVWSKNTEVEELLALIHNAMHANYKLAGLAEYSKRVSVDIFVIDPTKYLKSMIIKYQVIYRHILGNP